MRIASFNINGIKARLPRLKEWLEETRPAVACLQEIKTQDDGFPADEFAQIGYQAIWHGQKSFNGVAVLADGTAPVEIKRGLGIDGPNDGEGEQARYLEAEVNGVRICNLYLPNGNPHPGPKFDWRRLALSGHAVWPEAEGCGAGGWPAFRRAASRIGYGAPEGDWEAVLAAVRLRFRPEGLASPLDDRDVALVGALAEAHPCVDP